MSIDGTLSTLSFLLTSIQFFGSSCALAQLSTAYQEKLLLLLGLAPLLGLAFLGLRVLAVKVILLRRNRRSL